MKQRITAKQLVELSPNQLEIWRSWVANRGYSQRANIGELIEFLGEFELPHFTCNGGNAFEWWGYDQFEERKPEFLSITLFCDRLWEAVKEVLESGNHN